MSQSFLTTTTHNLAWFNKRNQADELELKAPFQRNPVWTAKQKSYLIDSMLRGFPVPELYMQEYTTSEGDDVYVVVDGQQRLRACFEYLVGDFAINKDDSPEWAGMKFDDLSEADKKKLYNYSFVVRILPEMADADLRSIFQRLNRNVVSLNPQELRHATYWGQFIQSMEELADDERWVDFGVFTPNDIRRMLDIEFISELAVGFLHGVQNKKDELDGWYKSYEEEFEDRSNLERRFDEVIGELSGILPDLPETRWRKKSDFYSLFLSLAVSKLDFPLASDSRKTFGDKLRKFGLEVDAYLRSPDEHSQVNQTVKDYAGAVERAASDLGNRRKRRDAINAILDISP